MDDTKWLISREIPHLRRYARALRRESDAADDLVQDCLERAIRKRHLWRRDGTIRSWLFRILHNLYVNDEKRRRRRRPVPIDEAWNLQPSLPGQEKRVEMLDVAAAMDRLPVEQRAAILLVALEGMTYDEAASTLRIPVGTLRSRISRGREALQGLGIPSARAAHIRSVK